MPNQNENQQQEKQPFFLLHLWGETKNAFRSKKAWVLLVFFLVLLFIGGFVPVGKIPFLRNLAYAMGYTPEETQKISLLRALFSWNEHQKILRGELPDPDAVSIFGEGGGFLTASAAKAQNKLISLRAVNSSLARKGLPPEGVEGVYYSLDTGENKKPSDIKIGDTNVSAATQANAAQTPEVYFGQDASAVTRDKTDGFNSVNSLKKIKNPNIAGAGPDDWFGRLVDKATRSDAGLSNIAKNIDKSGRLSKLGGVQELGDSRAHRDLYHAWLYGKTARRTPNPVLKKTLASASFDNAEMPRSVFSATGFSGVGINPDDVVADMDSVKKYLEQDKECQQAMSEVGEAVSEAKTEALEKIKEVRGSFPATCEAALNSNYGSMLGRINGLCKAVDNAYRHNLGKKCRIDIKSGSCNTDDLAVRFAAFQNYCNEQMRQCSAAATPEEVAACLANVNKQKSADYEGGACSSGCGADAITKLEEETFDNGNGNDTENKQDFFSKLGFGNGHFFWFENVD